MLKAFGKILVGIFAVIVFITFCVFIISFMMGNVDIAAKAFIAFCLLLPVPVILNLAIETDLFDNCGSPFGWF